MKKQPLISLKSLSLSVSAALACTAIPAHAATFYWDGTSTTGNADGGIGTWDNGITSNWCSLLTGGTNAAWINGNNIADFGATAGTVTLGAPITVGGLQFDTAGYIVQTGTLTFGTSGNIVTNANAAINSAIAAASGITITKTGTATLTLGGSNTYAGPTTISAGTLAAGGASAFSANSTFTVSGGVLDLNGFNATVAALGAGNSAGTITNSAAGSGTSTLTVTAFNVGLASLITDGTAQKTALAINTYSTPNFGNANNTFSGGITIANNARLWQGSISTTLSGATIQKSNFGTGTVTIGNSTSNGQLMLNSGSVYNPIVVNSATFADGGSAAFRIDGTGVQLYGQLTANLSDINMSSGGTGSVTAFGQLTSSGANGLTLKTPGTSFTLALSNTSTLNPNNYTGNTTISALTTLVLSGSGNEQIPNGAGKGNVALSGTLNMGGNSETINGLSGSGTVDNGVSGTPTLTVGDNNQTSTFSGAIVNTSGTLALTKIGTGTLTLSGTNTYAGATQVNAGLLLFSSTSAKSSGTATTLAAASIGLGVGAGSGGYGVTDVAALFNTNTLSGFNLVAGSGVALDTTGGNFNQTTGLTAARALTKLGSNTLTLSGSNSYNGNTTVSAGTLKAGGTSALSASSAFSVAAGATLDLGGYNNTIKSLGVDTATSTITDSSAAGSGGTLKVSTALGGTACAQLFTGSLGLQIYGGGLNTVLGNANNTYSGGTIIGNGSGSSSRPGISGIIGTLTSGTVSKGYFGTGTITFGVNATDKSQFYLTGAATINNNIVVNTSSGDGSQFGAFRLEASGGLLTIAGTVNANLADLMFEANNNTGMIANVTGAISGSSGVQVLAQSANGGITVTLSSTNALNSYAGNTTISGTGGNPGNATLKLGAADQIPNGPGKGNLVITSGTFNMNGFSETINGLSGNGTVDGASGTPTLTVGDNNATTLFSGKILNTSGTLALTKIGSGTLTLSGSDSYTGGTNLNAGTINFGNVNALGSGMLTFMGNATLQAGTAGTVANAVVFSGASTTGTLDTNGNNYTLSGIVSGSGALTKTGNGTLSLSGSNNYGGGTTVVNGTLLVGNVNALGGGATTVNGGILQYQQAQLFTSATMITVNSGGTLGLNVGGTNEFQSADLNNVFAGGGAVTFNAGSAVALDTSDAGGTFTHSGTISGSMGINKIGTGTLTLSGSNNYSGNTTISNGTLKAGGTTALTTSGTFSVATGATLDLGGFNNTIKSLATTGVGTITNSSGTATLKISTDVGATLHPQLFTGSLGLQIIGGYTGFNSLLNNTNNTYSGGTILGDGNNTAPTRPFVSGTIGTLTSGTVSSGIFGIGPITIGASTIDRAQLFFNGATTINNAIVVNTAVGDTAPAGAFRVDSTGNTIAGSINANLADAVFTTSGVGKTLSVTGAITGISGLQVVTTAANSLTVTLNNAGTANSYAGNTTISGTNAVLTLGRSDQIPNGAGKGNLTVTSGTFSMNGFNETINGLSGGGTVDGASSTPTLTVGDNNATSTFSGGIINTSGTLALTKIGAGTLTLSGSNSFTGGTIINGGILQYAKVQVLASASTVTVNSAGALGLNVGGTNEFTSANLDSLLSGTAGVTFNAGSSIALDTSNAGGTFTYASLISGSVGVIKLGASNPLVLSSSNTYLGVTKLSAGGLNSVILANGGVPSSIGASSNAAANLVIENGAQLNISTSGTTDRLFTLGSSGQAWVAANAGNFTFLNTGDIAVSGSASHNLRLGGLGSNTFAPAVRDYNSSNKTQFTVQNCAWTITGTSSDYTGVTNIDAAGTMLVTSLANGGVASSIGAASNVASNLVFGYDAAGLNNTLSYIGAGAASTDRLFTLGSKLGAGETSTIDNSGGDTLSFTNAGAIAVTCTGSTVLGFSGSNAISFAPIIANGSATVGLSKSGINTVTLTATNTYTGATTVSAGTLQIGNSGTTGSIASTSGVTLSTGSATLAFSRTDNYGGSFTQKISGSGGLALNSGSLTLTGNNTYNGATTVAADAALQLGDGVTGAMASTVTLNNGSTLGINLPNGAIFNAGINIGPGTVNLTSSGTNTITGQINGYSYCFLNQNGTGTTVLSYTNPFFGTANVNAGTLQLNAQYAAYDATVNVGASGLLTFGANAVNVGALSGSGGVVLQNGTNGVTLSAGANNQPTTFAGTLSGTNGALTMNGTNSTFTLTGLNTYTGLTSVSSGTLQIGNGGTTGSIASSGSISISSGATLAFDRSDDYGTTLSQPVTGTGRLLIASGSLTVSSTSSFSGDIAVASGGTLVPGTTAPLPSANLDGEGGTLNIGPMVSASFGGLKGAGNLNVVSTSGSAVTLNVGGNNQNTTFSGCLSGSNLSLTKAGTRTLTLTGSNSFTGGITVIGGGLTIGNVNAMGSGMLTTAMDAGITLTVNLPTSGTVANSISFTRPAGVQNEFILQGANNNLTLAGNINSNGNNAQFYPASGITSGTITLTGSNAFGGGAFFGQDLTIRFGNNYAGGTGTLYVTRPVETTPISVIVLDGVNLQAGISANGGSSDASPKPVYIGMEASGTASIIGSILMLNSATNGRTYYYQAPAGAQFTASGVLSGGVNSPVVTTGSGTVIFNNSSSSYGGSTTISGGILQVSALANGASNSSIGASTNAAANLVLNGGTLKYTGGTVSTDRQFTLGANGGVFDASGSGPLTFSNAAPVAYSGSGNRTLTLAGSNTGLNTLAGSIADNGADIVSLVKNGAGAWVLSGSNSFSGGTQVNGGLLVFENTSANSSGTVTAVAAASIGLGVGAISGGFSDSNVADLFNTNTLSGFNLAAGSGVALDTTGGDFTQTTGLTGARALTKLGSNTLTLSGSNTYTGNTIISAGTFKAGEASALTTSGTFSIATGATLDLGGFNATILTLSTSTGTITDSSAAGSGGTLKIATALSGGATSQLFTGSLGLQIYGGNAASTILANTANTYSGGTILGNGSGTTLTRWLGNGVIGTLTSGTVSSGIFGTGTITIGATTTDRSQFYFTGATTINNVIVVNSLLGDNSQFGAFRLEAPGSTVTIAGTLNANLADAVFESNNATGSAATVTGAISGLSGLQVLTQNNGGLTVTLNNAGTANSYAGNTTISGNGKATLKLGAADQIPNGAGKGNLTITSGTFNMNGFNEAINGLSGNGTVDGASGTPTLTVGDNDSTSTFSGKILNTSGTLALTKIGAGTLTLSGSNSYSGGTTVASGSLQLGNAAALGTGGLTVNGGALDLHGNNASVPGFSGSGGTITNTVSGTSTLTTTVATGTATYAGNITDGTGSIVLIQTGSGTLILSGSIAMTGLNANTGVVELAQSGSIAALNVASGATVALSANTSGTRQVLNISSLTISGFTSSLVASPTPAAVNFGALATAGIEANQGTTAANPAPASPEAVPEPGTWSMLTAGLGLLISGRRLRRRTSN